MCDCRKQECPVDGKCWTKKLIYKVTVKTEKYIETYINSTGFTKIVLNMKTIVINFIAIILETENNNIDFKIN